MSQRSAAASYSDLQGTNRVISRANHLWSLLTTDDSRRNTCIPNSFFLSASTSVPSIHTYIHHGIDITGNRTLELRPHSFFLFLFFLEWFGKIPWEASRHTYTVLFTHARTILDHWLHRHLISLELIRTEGLGRIKIEAMAGSRS